MSDRYNGFVVTFEHPIKDKDAKNIQIALMSIKGVVAVAPIIDEISTNQNLIHPVIGTDGHITSEPDEILSFTTQSGEPIYIKSDFIDKSSWPDGPWKYEPDRIYWVDPETGYHCIIKRIEDSGHLCGYVGVQKGHPFYQKYELDGKLKVHGDITYTEECNSGVFLLSRGKAWWIGFDCNHFNDRKPLENINFHHGEYRDIQYVKKEIESLAKQLKLLEN